MLKIRDRRIRIGLVLMLLAIVVAAIYQYALGRAANHEYQLAQQALVRCDFAEAGIRLEKYLAQYPSDMAARLLAAATARRRGDFADAGRHLNLAAQRSARANELALERDLLTIQEGDLSGADRLLSLYKENRNSPQARDVLEALIEGSLRGGDGALAMWSIDEWMRHSNSKLDQARGILWSAEVYQWTGQREFAFARYRKAAALAPDYFPARLAVASAWICTDPYQAATEIDWLRRHAPKRSSVRLLTAQWRRCLGQLDTARRLLDDLLAAEPDNAMALLERARVATDLYDAAGAERWLRHALQLAPDHVEINIAMGNCLRVAGRLDEAKMYQDKARQAKETEKKNLDHLLEKAKGRVANSP